MENITVSKGRYLKISPRKCRLVVDLIRGKDAGEELTILRFSKRKKASGIVSKVLNSAIANAQVKFPNIDVDQLYISRAFSRGRISADGSFAAPWNVKPRTTASSGTGTTSCAS